jgi:uncharacterized protein YjeT (DUF2065 family)
MLILAKLVAILIIVFGIIYLVSPKVVRQVISYFEQGKRIYAGGVIRILFSVILLLVASQCRWVGVVIVFGILFLVGGIFVFAFNLEKSKSILRWYAEKSDIVLRLFAILTVVIGVLLLFSI